MTQITTHHPGHKGGRSEPVGEPTPTFDLAWHSNDYLRRIHWWVRLFGIVWIVIPMATLVVGFFFFLGAGAMGRSADSATSSGAARCIRSGAFTATECVRMYPN